MRVLKEQLERKLLQLLAEGKLARLLGNLTDREFQSWREEADFAAANGELDAFAHRLKIRLAYLILPEDIGVRWRQLRKLLGGARVRE